MIPENKKNFILKKIENDCKLNHNEDFCQACRSKSYRVLSYAEANIPIEYWEKSWKDFKGDQKFKELIKSNLLSTDKINDVYLNGKSYAFVGNLGVGKTYALAAVLRFALTQNYSARFENMSNIINTILSSNTNEYLQELMNIDFLGIDEFTTRWIFPSEKSEKMFGVTMENILRNRFQNKLPTFLCSNDLELDKVLSDDFSKAFESLRNQYINVIYVSGKDFRKNGSR